MPRLRNSYSTQSSASALATAVQRWLEDSDPTVLFRTCTTCYAMNLDTAVCKKFKRVPPVAVIAGRTNCEGYSDNEDIPF